MLRKFFRLMVAVVIAASITACHKGGNNGTSSTGETGSNPAGLPADIPVHPASEFVGKHTENQKEIYDFNVKASVLEVTNFYDKELKKRAWELDPNPAPSQEQVTIYFKSDRALTVLPAK